MKEQELVDRVAELLAEQGAGEDVIAAGIFNPRGHIGAGLVGGLAGDSVAGPLGDLADSIGTVGGSLAASRMHDAATGLPQWLVVAVTPTSVVGFDTDRRRRPDRVIFRLDRARLDAKVHQRVNVRILELIDRDTGSGVQLEGMRVPTLHTGDVFSALRAE